METFAVMGTLYLLDSSFQFRCVRIFPPPDAGGFSQLLRNR